MCVCVHVCGAWDGCLGASAFEWVWVWGTYERMGGCLCVCESISTNLYTKQICNYSSAKGPTLLPS